VLTVDAIVYGGGSVYKELYASTRRGPYAVITRVMVFNLLARALRRPVYNLNISIGHIGSRKRRWITKLGLLSSNATLMRDERSYDYALGALRLNPSKIVNSTDGLFLSPEWDGAPRPAPSRSHPVIGVNLVSDIPDWIDRSAYLAAANEFLRRLLRRGDEVTLMPFQADFSPDNDRLFMAQEIDAAILEHPRCTFLRRVTIDDVQARFAELDLFVGMRFHSLLLADVTQTPFVGISYDVKCTRFLAESAYDHWVELEGLTADDLLTVLDALARTKASRTSALGEAVRPRFMQARADLAAAIPAFALSRG
jgi:polysaccharide pyruvyl transferase WcaK-like protein